MPSPLPPARHSATAAFETPPRGKGSSIFETDKHGREQLQYGGKKITDSIGTAEVKKKSFTH